MKTDPNVDYVLVGHVTRDLITRDHTDQPFGSRYTNGGTATYAALTALGFGQSTGLITQTRSKQDLEILRDNHIHVAWSCSDCTTTFENRYAGDVRAQHLVAFAGQIPLQTMPSSWRNAQIVHIGPIYHECSVEWLSAFSAHTYIGVTPQGWLRATDVDGNIIHRRLPDKVLAELANTTAVVISQEDIDGDLDYAAYLAKQCPLLIVTSGWQGGVVYEPGQVPWSFPTPTVREVDPTGAGDIFATVFFLMHATGRTVKEAIRIAACAASQSVIRRSLQSIPTKAEIVLCTES